MTGCVKPSHFAKVALEFLLFASFINKAKGIFKLEKDFDDMASTLNVRFTYDGIYTHTNHSFSINHDNVLLFTCRLSGERGDEAPSNNHYQVVNIPVEYIMRTIRDKLTFSLLVIVRASGSLNRITGLTIPFYRTKHSHFDHFNATIDIHSAGKFIGSATLNKTDTAIPRVSQKARISIKLSKTFPAFRYKMFLHRIDTFEPDLCTTENLGGEINLEEYISIFALERCELSMNRSELVLQTFAMPFGYIRVSMDVTNTTSNAHFRIHRYFIVEEEIEPDKVPFQPITWPNVEVYTLPLQRRLFIDTSYSFFPYAQKSFGIDGINKPVHSYTRTCLGHDGICRLILAQEGNVINIGLSMRVARTAHEATLLVSISWYMKLHPLGNTYTSTITKAINFRGSSLIVDIICVRNCRYRFSPSSPALYRAKCFGCTEKPGDQMRYKWNVQNSGLKIAGNTTKYLAILEYTLPSGTPFKIHVTVFHDQLVRDEKKNITFVKTRYGTASANVRPSMNYKLVWFNTDIVRSTLPTYFDTFDFSVIPRPPLQVEEALPIVIYFRTHHRWLGKKVDVCTYAAPYTDLALSPAVSATGYIGLRTAGGKAYEHVETLPSYSGNAKRKATNLTEKCQKIADGTAGLTYILALAQELAMNVTTGPWVPVPDDVLKCYKMVIDFMDKNPSASKTAYFIHNLFLFKMHYIWNTADLYTGIKNLEEQREKLFHNTVMQTEELVALTRPVLRGLTEFLVFGHEAKKAKEIEIRTKEHTCVTSIFDAMLALVQLLEVEGRWEIFNFPFARVAGTWHDVATTPNTTLEWKNSEVDIRVVIRKEVFTKTLDDFNQYFSMNINEDTFFNIIVLVTAQNINLYGGPFWQFGSVLLMTELRTTKQKFQVNPATVPIIIDFKQQRLKREFKAVQMEVVYGNGKIVDSTCLTLEVSRTDKKNVTVNFDFPDNYTYSYAFINARYQSEIVNLLDRPFKSFQGKTTHLVPKLTSVENYMYPNSKALFMIRVDELRSGDAPTMGASSKTNEDILENSTQTDAFWGNVDVLISQCFYHRSGQWQSDSSCHAVPQEDPTVVSCHCTINTAYTVKQRADSSRVDVTSPTNIHYHGPTILPNLFVGALLVTFVLYAYWAYFQDIKERDCAQTHVVKNMYDPNSIEQYLICISTGVFPGAGTDSRVGFLLVGELGSLQYVIPEGTHAHTTGSEIWFMLSSDLELGNIMGISVKYDKYVSGAVLYPWLLKSVLLYCMRNNQVIEFKCNQLLGLHLPSIMLPTVPHKFLYGGETRARFWKLLRRYHSLASVLFHIPGIGVTNVLSALSSLFVVLGTCAVAIEVVGGPTLINHMHMSQTGDNYLTSIIQLSPISLCLTIGIKNIYNLVFRKSVGVIWYNKWQPYEGYWQGGTPSKSWLSLMVSDTWREKHVFYSIQTWLSQKRAYSRRRRKLRNSPVVSDSDAKHHPLAASDTRSLTRPCSTAQMSVKSLRKKQYDDSAFFGPRLSFEETYQSALAQSQEKLEDQKLQGKNLLSWVTNWQPEFLKKPEAPSKRPSPHRKGNLANQTPVEADHPMNILPPGDLTSEPKRAPKDDVSKAKKEKAAAKKLNPPSVSNEVEKDKNKNRGEDSDDTETTFSDSEGSESQASSSSSDMTIGYEGSSTNTNEEVTEQASRGEGQHQTSFKEQTQSKSPHMQQGVIAEEVKVLSLRTPSSSTASPEDIATDASDEASTAAQGNSSHQPRVDFKRSKRYLSKRNVQKRSPEKPLKRKGGVRGTGDMSSEARHPSMLDLPPNELSFQVAPNRPGFVLVKRPGRLAVSRRDVQLNRWRMIGKDEDRCQKGGRVKRRVTRSSVANRQAPERVMTSSDALLSDKRGKSCSEGITSFREYYFRPVLMWENEKQQVRTASPPKTDYQFLRKSRYLEKMVRDYDLGATIQSKLGNSDDGNKSSPEWPGSSKSLYPRQRSTLGCQRQAWNTTARRRGMLGDLSKLKLKSKRNDYETFSALKRRHKTLDASRVSLRGVRDSKSKRRRKSKKTAPLSGKPARCWLLKLCIQFDDSESDGDTSSSLSSTAEKMSKPYSTGRPFQVNHFNSLQHKPHFYCSKSIAFPERRVSDHCSKFLLERDDTTHTAGLRFHLNREHESLSNDHFQRLGVPGVATSSKRDQRLHFSRLRPASNGGTLAMLRRRAQIFLTRFPFQNNSTPAEIRRAGVPSDSSTYTAWSLPNFLSSSSSSTDHDNNTKRHLTRRSAGPFRSLKLKRNAADKNRSSLKPSSSSLEHGGTPKEESLDPEPRQQSTTVRNLVGSSAINYDRKSGGTASDAKTATTNTKKSVTNGPSPELVIGKLVELNSSDLRLDKENLVEDELGDTKAPGGGDNVAGKKKNCSKGADRRKHLRFRLRFGPKVKNIVDRHLYAFTGVCYLFYHFLRDFIRSFWNVRMYLIQIPVVILTVSGVILFAGWVHVNSTYYSFQKGKDWMVIVLATLMVNILVIEPLLYLNAAAISTYIWETPQVITECLKRFKTVIGDLDLREYMVTLRLAGHHRTCFIHDQAAPESASLFHLHDKIFKALTRVTQLPHVTFSKDVYWLILYTACTIILVNAQSDIFSQCNQKNHIRTRLHLPPVESATTSVAKMWDFIILTLIPGMLELKSYHNITVSGDESEKIDLDPGSPKSLGGMVLAPMRIRQLRVRDLFPGEHKKMCNQLPRVKIDSERCGNLEFSLEREGTKDFGSYGKSPYQASVLKDSFTYRETTDFGLLTRVDMLPKNGYWTVVHFDNLDTPGRLEKLKDSEWIDEHTRYILIDFALLNVGSSIASAFRITVEFKRPGPFWSTSDFHFRFEQPFWYYYLVYIVGGIFWIITLHTLIREVLSINRDGFWLYSTYIKNYIELSKIGLSFVLCYAYLQQQNILTFQLNELRYGYLSKRTPEFVDFFEMANLDSLYKTAGGFLAFLCMFQIFSMLSKIRRLLVFIRMLWSAFYLLAMPIVTGTAFSFLSYFLFGTTVREFSNPVTCYLIITQFFIKPQAIYSTLSVVHPYLGPYFVFSLGFCINFFVLNFFIAFLNEAYSSIMSQVRLQNYKHREKTKLEYVYEFLGIQSTHMWWDKDEEQKFNERRLEIEFLKNLKSIHAN